MEGSGHHLLVNPPNGPERVVQLGLDTVTLGRSDANTLPLADTMASRFHARIECEEDGYYVIDRGSKNGTLVQGVSVKRHRLHDGDEILIGDTRIAFIAVGDPQATPRRAPPPTLAAPRPKIAPPIKAVTHTEFAPELAAEPLPAAGPGAVAALARFSAILAYAEQPSMETLDAAAEELFEIVDCDRATIMVLDDEGEVARRFQHDRIGIGDGEDHDAQVISAARAIERPICLRVPRTGAGAVIGASFGVKRHLLMHPVRAGQRRAGLVALERDPAREPFDDDDLEWASIVCAHLATYLLLCARSHVASDV